MRSLLAMHCMLLAALVFAPAHLSAQAIGVYRDIQALECPNIPNLTPTMVYVVASLAPQACGGISGAEFALQGWPTNWIYVPQPGPGIPEGFGDPFGDGAQINLGCLQSESGAVVVLPILVLAISSVMDLPVTVVAHRTAAAPPFNCPVLELCDAPVSTSVCATGFQTRINSSIGFCPCQNVCYEPCPPIGVEANSWSGIKRLYN